MKSKIVLMIILIGLFTITSSYTKDPNKKIKNVYFILDASSSMDNKFIASGKETKYKKLDLAKASLISRLNEMSRQIDLKIGIMVFYDCGVIKEIKKLKDKLNLSELKKNINEINIGSSTPIAKSLILAGENIKSYCKDNQGFNYENIIVLISDGLEECGGDPCSAASELESKRIVSSINVIGLEDSPKIKEYYRCIARNGIVEIPKKPEDIIVVLKKSSDQVDNKPEIKPINVVKELPNISNENPVWSPDGKKVAFVSKDKNKSDICLINIDSSEASAPINLTQSIGYNYDPTWSPDGKKIAYVSTRDGNSDIFLMDSDGKNPLNISKSKENESFPAWSPDGKRIAFAARMGWYDDIFVMNTDGSDLKRLTKNIGSDGVPFWSFDSKKIVFSSKNKGIWNIYSVNADGKDLNNLSGRTNSEDIEPSLSYDGKQIVYSSDGGEWKNFHDIFVYDIKTKRKDRLTMNIIDDRLPVFSPDGTQIAFKSFVNQNWGIYIMNNNGTDLTKLTDKVGRQYKPAWSPDGSKIAFSSDKDGILEIYIINSDGKNLKKLTDSTLIEKENEKKTTVSANN